MNSRNAALLHEAERRLWATEGVEPAERRVRLRRAGIDVRVQELGDGPPVLFIHGASNSGTSWASLAARLPGFRCLLLDRPGCGLSDPLRTRMRGIDDLASLGDDLVADVLDGLGLDAAAVAASSFGGYFALRGALAHPERVGRIVMLGWTAGAPLGKMPGLMRLAGTPPLGNLLSRLPAGERTVRSMFRSIGLGHALDAGRVSGEAIAAYAALLNNTDSMRNDIDMGRWIMSPARGLDPRLVLGEEDRARVRQPILFLWGEDDPFGGAAIARDYVRPFPNARLELIPGAGHAVWVDDAGMAAGDVARFLSGAS